MRCENGHYAYWPARRKDIRCEKCGAPMVNAQTQTRPRKYKPGNIATYPTGAER